ncbi:glycoside-pentoside-hexuronide (GPH):cation symporter [Ruminococcaceae bacterium OttesenSCG-928-I18]|nr:glycoside-pentoside-hexuronide (GPH):cation symporter [Ruminococcaceae bacterium OttesenSCG-928-I18]
MGTKKLTMGRTLGYGVGSIGENIAYTVFYNFFLFFLTDLIGLSATLAGTISFVAVLWDAVTDPAVGYWSDMSRNPKGRRRPILFKGCFALGAAIFLMFTDMQFLPMEAKGAYFLVVNMLFWLFLTMSDIPYLSLAAEMEATPQGRTRLRSVAAAFLQGGMLIASAGMLPLVNLFGGTDHVLRGWSIAGAIMGICAIAAYLISWMATNGLEPENPNLKKKKAEPGQEHDNPLKAEHGSVGGFIKSTARLLSYKPYLILLLLTFFVWFSANMQNSSLMYFCTYNAGMSDAQISTQFLVVGIACAIGPLIVAPITNRFGKKATALVAYSVAGVLTIVMAFVKPWDITYVYLFRILSIIILSIWYVTIYAMVYDVSDLDEYENKHRREGGMQSMFQFSIKLATAVSMFLVGILLDVYGYQADAATQTETALNGIKDLTILFPGIMLLVGVLVIIFYPISNKRMKEVAAKLKEQNDGAENA